MEDEPLRSSCARLRKQFGELVTLGTVAEILYCDRVALRRKIKHNKAQPRMRLLAMGKRKIGKRIFFSVDSLAAVLVCSDSTVMEILNSERTVE